GDHAGEGRAEANRSRGHRVGRRRSGWRDARARRDQEIAITNEVRDYMADLNTLNVLFENELRDVYDAEKQILKALPKIIKAVTNDDLRKALSAHLEETRGQVVRLEQAFESLD